MSQPEINAWLSVVTPVVVVVLYLFQKLDAVRVKMRLDRQDKTAADAQAERNRKFDELKRQNNSIHSLVNGMRLSEIKMRMVLARKIAVLSKEPEDIRFAQICEDTFTDYSNQQPASRVLLIEDNTSDIYITKIMLERLGFVVEVAPNEPQVREAFRSEKDYLLIFFDLIMPGIDTLELFKSIRRERTATPIVILTGADISSPVANSFIKQGYLEIVMKPLQETDVVEICTKHHIHIPKER